MTRVVCLGVVAALLAGPAAAQEVSFGVQVVDLTAAPHPENVQVQNVTARALADSLGIRPGDVFVQVNDQVISLASDLDRVRTATVLDVVWKSGGDYYRNVARKLQPKLVEGPDYETPLPPGAVEMATVQQQVQSTEYRQEVRTIIVNGMQRTVTVNVPVTTHRTVTVQVLRPKKRLGITVAPGPAGDVVQVVEERQPACRGTMTVNGQPVTVRLEPGDLILPTGRAGLPNGPIVAALQQATGSHITLSVRDSRTGRVNSITFDLDPHSTLRTSVRNGAAPAVLPPPK